MRAASYPDSMSGSTDVVEDPNPPAGWRRALRFLPDRVALATILAVSYATDFVNGCWGTLAVVVAVLLAMSAIERAWKRRRAAKA